MRQLFNASPKIRGSSPKKFGTPKTCKIWTDFTQLPTFRCWTLKFLHTAEVHQGLLTHITSRVGAPQKNFKVDHLKLGLKFYIWAPITLGVVGLTSRNFTRRGGSRPRSSSWHLILQGVPPTKFRRAKSPKFGAIFDNFRLWSRMSQECIDLSKIWIVLDQLHFISYWAQKIGWTLVH